MGALHRLAFLGMRAWWHLRRPVTVGVVVLLVRDGRVLLVRQTYRRGWSAPGGGVRWGETLEEAARREIAEEVGGRMGELELLGVYTGFRRPWLRPGERAGKSDHVAVFACEDFAFTGDHDGEIAEIALFPLDALPADTRGGTARRIAEYRAGRRGLFGPW